MLPKCSEGTEDKRDSQPRFPRHSRTLDLMTLNKRICEEVSEVLYEERTFVIHVHEGLLHGGIELLDTGRQPLHFQDSSSDARFWKFSDGEKDFGFRRLKKIIIQIYPSTEENSKHSAINTYLVNLALVRLLERSSEEKHRITSLSIEFMKSQRTGREQGRRAIQNAEHYWWDPNKNRPRETSVHGLPNIELVLRPFANLTGCHNVNIEAPVQFENDVRTTNFIKDLKASMTSPYGTLFADDDLDRKIESARWAMEDHIYSMKHGAKHREVSNLTDSEMQEAYVDSDGEESSSSRKRTLSPRKRADSPGSDTKKSRRQQGIQAWQDLAERSNSGGGSSEEGDEDDEDEELARVLKESEKSAADDDEARQIRQAIEKSLRRDVDPWMPDRPRLSAAQALRQRSGDRSAASSKAPSNESAFRGPGYFLVETDDTVMSEPYDDEAIEIIGSSMPPTVPKRQVCPGLERWLDEPHNRFDAPVALGNLYRERTSIQSPPALASDQSFTPSPDSPFTAASYSPSGEAIAGHGDESHTTTSPPALSGSPLRRARMRAFLSRRVDGQRPASANSNTTKDGEPRIPGPWPSEAVNIGAQFQAESSNNGGYQVTAPTMRLVKPIFATEVIVLSDSDDSGTGAS